MKQTITFVHPQFFKRIEVQVGPDHLLMVAGGLAALVRLGEVMSGVSFGWQWYAVATVVAHLRLWRNAGTWPVLGSIALALMSSGMAMLISGTVLNRLIAQRYRDGGWKIRNTDGELGEYSSRFLAVDHLGFRESDLMGAEARELRAAHRTARPRSGVTARTGYVDTVIG
jgi:hypothetical protein